MNRRIGLTSSVWLIGALVVGLSSGVALAENVDPDNDGSQYAWGENVGWLNAEPNGEGGPGIEVTDTDLSGFLWGENIGWINFAQMGGPVVFGVTTAWSASDAALDALE